jgi:hypothetical protein
VRTTQSAQWVEALWLAKELVDRALRVRVQLPAAFELLHHVACQELEGNGTLPTVLLDSQLGLKLPLHPQHLPADVVRHVVFLLVVAVADVPSGAGPLQSAKASSDLLAFRQALA